MTEHDRRTVTGPQLSAAERLMSQYFTANPDAGSEEARDFNQMVGLTDGWNEASLHIAHAKADGILQALGMDLEAPAAIVPVRTLREVTAAVGLQGMVLGAIAALGITDPDEPTEP